MKFFSHAYLNYTAVSAVAIVANVGLMAAKLVVGLLLGSFSLVADGAHSLADVLGVIVVFVGLHISARPADSEHPYGHSKAEPVAELIVAFIIIATGVIITYDSVLSLREPSVVADLPIGILVAVVSTVVASLLALYKRRAGVKIKSSALNAEARHSAVDAFSSFAVVIGLILTGVGYWFMDPVAGILVSLLIIQIGVSVARTAVDTLMDRETSPELIERVKATAESVPGVVHVEYVHTRGSWSHKIVDMSIVVSSGSTVRELSETQEQIKSAVYAEIPEIYQANVIAHAHSDILKVAISSDGSGIDDAFAGDLGNAPYFIIIRLNKDTPDVLGSFVNPFTNVSRKKGAMVARFMHEHEVDLVITGHAGEGAVQWLRGYGIELKLVHSSKQKIRDILKLLTSTSAA